MCVCSIGTSLHFCSVTKNLLHKRVSLVDTNQRPYHSIRLESPRWHTKVKMLCLVRCQLGLSLYDDTLHLRWKILSETILHLTNPVADARRELHGSSLPCSRRLIQCHFRLYFWLSLQTIECAFLILLFFNTLFFVVSRQQSNQNPNLYKFAPR